MKRFVMVLGTAGLLFLLVFSPYGCSKKSNYPRQISLAEANKIVNAPLPVPAYVPENFSIRAIYALEHTDTSERLAITFYPKGSEDDGVTNIDKAPIRMDVQLFPRAGAPGGLKLVGEEYDIAGTRGVLVTRDESNDLWWILPYRESGQYRIALMAAKNIPKEELVKMARSVPH